MFELHALPTWRCVDLASDLHLDGGTPRTASAFVHYLQRTEADAVLLLGDLFEVWVGPEMAEPPGPEAVIAGALRDTARTRTIGFLCGNRDFLLDDVTGRRLGLTPLPDPTVLVAWGQRTVLTHGDAWCLDDHDYLRFRAEVRTPAWQATFLERPLAERRALAAGIRAQSEARKRELGMDAYGDIDRSHALAQLHDAGARRLIHGHTHRPADEVWRDPRSSPDGAVAVERHVLSDWDLDHATPPRAEILRLTPDGWQRRHVHADGSTVAVASHPRT